MTREERENAIKVIKNYDLNFHKINGLLFKAEEIANAFDCALEALEQEPKAGHWIYDKSIENWKCSECGETPKTLGYVGDEEFMKEHFKLCNHCGCKMEG